MDYKRKILIVDDNNINRKILKKILGEEYDVLMAVNGKVALDILDKEQDRISLILLDLVMPVMDGYTFLSEFAKRDVIISSIPVIVATQRDSEEDEEKALTKGASDFVTKPYKAKIIRQKVKNLINLREKSQIINVLERDRLTGLLSREFFNKKVDDIIKNKNDEKYWLICADIKNFKLVNDIFGREMGDKLLKYFAETLKTFVENKGVIGRIGADIFSIFIEKTENQNIYDFEKFNEKINNFEIDNVISVKFGVYEINEKNSTNISASQMCDRAILAIEKVKGKYAQTYAFYDEAIIERLMREKQITENMDRGILEKQFKVYLQPKHDIESNKMVGAEALVRWIHSELGFISPADFIPIFEKNGFITKLDKYMWDESCKLIRKWKDEKKPTVPISVNLSRVDIFNPKLKKNLLDAVKKYNLQTSDLHIEITESAYTDNPKQIIETVKDLRKQGFVIEMDDFGTGYSSLSMLSDLPIDVLKLDMSFIRNSIGDKADENPKNLEILKFIIGLAKWLDLTTVAEGVETKEQLEKLREFDCEYVQGYYFAKPMEAEQFEEYLMKTNQ